MADSDLLKQELYYLIARFLAGGPCERAARAIREEIDEHKLLTQRIDYEGNRHDISLDFMERLCPVESGRLLQLCENLCTALNIAVPTALPKAPRSLLADGRHGGALRTKESVLERRRFFTTEPFMERHGQKMLNPLTTLCPSVALLTEARRLTTSKNLLSIAPVNMYSNSSLFRRIAGHLSAVYCVLYDHTGKYIFTGADDILVKIWSAIDGRLMATLRGHASEITDLTLSPDNSMLASGSLDKTIRVWCLKSLRPVAVLIGHTSMVTSLKFCPSVRQDKSFLTSTGNDGSLCFWEYDVKKKLFQTEPRCFTDRAGAGVAAPKQLLCQSFSPGGTLLATGSADHKVRIYQVFKPSESLASRQEPERIAELSAHTDRVDSIQFANNDIRLITGSRDGTANIWTFKANRWTNITLKMTTNLDGTTRDTSQNDDGAHSELVKTKMKVNMVAWTKDDASVLTTVSDHSVKIWNSRSGQLLKVLKGHEDDVYSLECHPTDRRILYTGGHDGRVIIWDMTAGKSLKTFFNFFEGQGFGAMFDLKVSPDGLTFCATDSHGHLSLFGLGNGEAYAKVPDEQFFHTDYLPLLRDANHHVLDEQTQVAPHLMPAPFLVNIDLRPYPPNYQRLVPGRELCPDELLVPIENRDQNQEQDPNRRPNIDDMIQRLQDQQGNNAPGPAAAAAAEAEGQGPPTPSRRGGARREGEVEGVRQGGNWGQASNAMNVPRKKVVVTPLSPSEIERELHRSSVLADFEMVEFHREKRREQLEVNTSKFYGLRQNKERGGLANGSSRSRRGVVTLSDYNRSTGRATRSSMPIEEMEIDDDEFDEIGESDSDYEQDSPGRERNRNRNRNRESERNGARENGHGAASSSSRGITRSRRGNPVRDEAPSANTSSTGTEEDEDDSEGSSPDEDEENQQSDSEHNRDSSVRRSARQRNSKKTAKSRSATRERKSSRSKKPARKRARLEGEDGEEHDQDDDEEIERAGPSTSSGRRPRELQEKFRPPDWLTDTIPRRTPYLPQVGDLLMYFQQGHQLYCDAVRNQRLYKVEKHHRFQWNKKLREQEKVRVLDVKFELLPPRLCCLKVECTDPGGPNSDEAFWIRYHDTSDVIDFLVLHQIFQTARERDWKAGDRFRSIIEDQWWLGTITAHEPYQPEFPDSMFQCFKVKWDNGEEEQMSPWDFEPVDHTRLPTTPGGGVEITQGEREALQYVPSQEDFDTESRDAFRARMMKNLDYVMGLSIAEPFLVPVDLNSYPDYATVVAYPMDLSTIKSRLENNFYRRKAGIKFDVSYIQYNADQYNESSSEIVKKGKRLTEVLLQFINDSSTDEPPVIYRRFVSDTTSSRSDFSSDYDSGGPGPSRKLYLNNYTSSKRSVKKEGDETRRPNTRTTSSWREDCAELLAKVHSRKDAEIFRDLNEIDQEDCPDYFQVIDTPMDLKTVRRNLENGDYATPQDFHRDMQLIFSNSRTYNTNERSRVYCYTIKVSQFFETNMEVILKDHRAAVKRSNCRKTYEEEDDSDDEKYSKKIKPQRANPRRSNPIKEVKVETNGHSSGSRISSSGSSGSSTRSRRHVETEDDEEVVTKTTSTRSGRVVRPTRFNDMVSISDDETDDRQRRRRSGTRPTREMPSRKRKITTETEDDKDDVSSEEVKPERTLTTRSGRAIKIAGNHSSTTGTMSSSATSHSPTTSTSDESCVGTRRRSAAASAATALANQRKSSNNGRARPSLRRKKESTEEDEEDEDDDEDEEEDDVDDEDEEEDDAASSEGVTTEGSPGQGRRSTRTRGSSQAANQSSTRETSEDSSPPRRSSRQKKPVQSKTNENNNISSGGAVSERPVRAARSKRPLHLDEDSEDYDKDYEEMPSSRSKRSRTRVSNGSNSNHYFD